MSVFNRKLSAYAPPPPPPRWSTASRGNVIPSSVQDLWVMDVETALNDASAKLASAEDRIKALEERIELLEDDFYAGKT